MAQSRQRVTPIAQRSQSIIVPSPHAFGELDRHTLRAPSDISRGTGTGTGRRYTGRDGRGPGAASGSVCPVGLTGCEPAQLSTPSCPLLAGSWTVAFARVEHAKLCHCPSGRRLITEATMIM